MLFGSAVQTAFALNHGAKMKCNQMGPQPLAVGPTPKLMAQSQMQKHLRDAFASAAQNTLLIIDVFANFQIQPPKFYLIIYFQNNGILLFANDKKTVHFSPSTKCRFAFRNSKYFKNCKKFINYLKKYFILLSRRKRGKTHVNAQRENMFQYT